MGMKCITPIVRADGLPFASCQHLFRAIALTLHRISATNGKEACKIFVTLIARKHILHWMLIRTDMNMGT
jgi:hypothetical protein